MKKLRLLQLLVRELMAVEVGFQGGGEAKEAKKEVHDSEERRGLLGEEKHGGEESGGVALKGVVVEEDNCEEL